MHIFDLNQEKWGLSFLAIDYGLSSPKVAISLNQENEVKKTQFTVKPRRAKKKDRNQIEK